jgi:hypothetical protein
MSIQVSTAFVQQYTRGIDLLVQQKGSRFRNAVRMETGVTGKQAFFDQIGATAAVKRTTRHSDTPIVNTPHARRMAPMIDYEWGDLVDDPDKIKVLNDPTNTYSMNAAHAMSRAMDDEVIDAALGTAATGETGTGTATLPAGQIDGTAAGFTVARLVTASANLKTNENDMDEPWYSTLSAAGEEDLITDTTHTVSSRDFTNQQPFVTGKLNSLMGFSFIHTQRHLLTATSEQRHFLWRQSAILLAIGKDSTGRIAERADKSFSTQVFYSMTIGAVRMEELGVYELQVTP